MNGNNTDDETIFRPFKSTSSLKTENTVDNINHKLSNESMNNNMTVPALNATQNTQKSHLNRSKLVGSQNLLR